MISLHPIWPGLEVYKDGANQSSDLSEGLREEGQGKQTVGNAGGGGEERGGMR